MLNTVSEAKLDRLAVSSSLFQKMNQLFICLLCTGLFILPSESHKLSHHRTQHHSSRHPHNEIEVLPEDALERLAFQHSQRVAEAGSCNLPKEQVIHISDHYPGRYYLPHCTLLHRCGKHVGCCGTDRLKCVAEVKQKVTLPFYSVRLVGHGKPAEKKVEMLTFTNHTKCGCIPIGHINKQDIF